MGNPNAKKEVPGWLKVAYCFLNIAAGSAIVFANKAVFLYGFKFVATLTLVHTIVTWIGMNVLSLIGYFQPKTLLWHQVIQLALCFVGYVVLNNISLNLNTVGFYQILKISITPSIMLIEYFMYSKRATPRVTLSVVVVCAGVMIATVTDTVAIQNVLGVLVGLASVAVTAFYQVWAGTKQKELQANSSQLLLAYTPQAIAMLLVLVPVVDNVGFQEPRGTDTVLGYKFTAPAVAAIVVSALLGVVVSLSTFLVIGATSSLTYNIVGHLKTVAIVSGGCLLFGDSMPFKKFLGVCVTMSGIAWYTYLTVVQAAPSEPPKADEVVEKNAVGTSGSRRESEKGSGEQEPLLSQAVNKGSV